jgi:hypothetical protein
MRLPPPLAWLESFVGSLGRALGQKMGFESSSTVNPLVYKVRLRWEDPLSPTTANLLWNHLQGWAAMNECIPTGKVSLEGPGDTVLYLEASIIIKRRLGAPRNDVSWE